MLRGIAVLFGIIKVVLLSFGCRILLNGCRSLRLKIH